MKTVTPLDLRRSLGSILYAASAGERFLIERDHRPIAVRSPWRTAGASRTMWRSEGNGRWQRSHRLQALGDEMRRGHPGGPSAVDAIRADRDRDDA